MGSRCFACLGVWVLHINKADCRSHEVTVSPNLEVVGRRLRSDDGSNSSSTDTPDSDAPEANVPLAEPRPEAQGNAMIQPGQVENAPVEVVPARMLAPQKVARTEGAMAKISSYLGVPETVGVVNKLNKQQRQRGHVVI
jgi:hypothetical protein